MIQNTVRQLATTSRRRLPTNIASTNIGRRFSSDNDRIHSTDIAFKPAESGWGGGTKYSNNYENIFGTKKNETNSVTENTPNAKSSNHTTTTNQSKK